MIRKPIKRRTSIVLGIASMLLVLMSYTWLSHRQHTANPNDTTIPSWSQIKDGVGKAVEVNKRSGERWIVVDTKATLGRLSLGLGLAVAGSLVIGLLMGCYTPVESFLYPPLAFFAKVTPTAALAVFFVLVGTEMKMYVAMIVFGILPTLSQSIYLAVKSFPEELLHKAYTLGASQAEVIWEIIVRYVLPKVIDGIRLSIGPAMVYLIAAEMMVGDVGFGYRIRLESKLLNMNVVYPYLALLAGFGFGMDFGLRRLRQKLFPWVEGIH